MQKQQHINIGLVAHVDAGKTTLTEMLLYNAGVIKSPGSVDKGTSQTDQLEVEKLRGISVRSASAALKWNNININIIDTPGHADFSAEVERALLALDCAILVVSAYEGVQAHTETIWTALKQLRIPVIIFVNKIDRQGCDVSKVIGQIQKYLTKDIAIFQSVDNIATNAPVVCDQLNEHDFRNIDDSSLETVINYNDILLEKYLNEEKIYFNEFIESLKQQTNSRTVFPVLFGSSKLNIGIRELLTTITDIINAPSYDSNSDVSGIIFKVEHDSSLGRVAHVRLFSGEISSRDEVFVSNSPDAYKITQIRKIEGHKYKQVDSFSTGDVAAVCGLSSAIAGDYIGISRDKSINLNTPLLTVSITPANHNEYTRLVESVQQLSIEDPALDLKWLKDERELQIKIMGIIQIQILKSVLLDRFGIEAVFSDPTVIYKETLADKGFAYEEYTMPKPCWAVVKFHIEPGKRGSGVSFSSQVGVNDIAQRYQNEVERTIPKALEQGMFGWEVTDIKITLIGGEDHNVHSRAGDFAIATPMALMKAFRDIGTTLLEPVLKYTISAPEEYLGKIASSLTILRTEIGNPIIEDETFTLSGIIPAKESLDYATKLASITKGRGKYATIFNGYRECSVEEGATTPFRGINPLDRSKYILKARKALSQ